MIKIRGKEKKLTLEDVKIRGTEGRNAVIGEPEKPAPPGDKNFFKQVEFSIDMIKEMTITEPPQV